MKRKEEMSAILYIIIIYSKAKKDKKGKRTDEGVI